MSVELSNEVLEAFGVPKKKIAETQKSQKTLNSIRDTLEDAKTVDFVLGETSLPWESCLYDVATTFPTRKYKDAIRHRPFLVKHLLSGKINRGRQFQICKDYIEQFAFSESIEEDAFLENCGIGLVITPEEIKTHIETLVEENLETITKNEWNAYGQIQKLVKQHKILRFCDSKDLLFINQIFEEKFGDRKAWVQKNKKNNKGKKNKKNSDKNNNNNNNDDNKDKKLFDYDTLPDSIEFHDPKDNTQADPKLLEKHLEETGGMVITRFPPEPNGYLHIGHAKSMNLNFGYAKKKGGICYMRFDDTNPEKEKQEYIDAILEAVKWMGHKWVKVTYSSEYFDTLFDLAVKLIKKGLAYVCHQTQTEMQECRRNGIESPWRDRTVEENLKLFYDMKKGKYEEGAATLRMKGDMKSPNMNMRDHVAYRIKYSSHPHVGDKWCIYPSYDFTHCICDSLENITHSLCTVEFDNRRESYEWLCRSLEIYCPPQIEFSRLRVTNYLMSKRRIDRLIKTGVISGWADPRLPTILGVRRRGYPPEAINKFCECVGITRREQMIDLSLLEHFIRRHLDNTAPRVMCVIDPIKITLTNWDDDRSEKISIFKHPKKKEMGSNEITVTKTIYIERSDFRMEDSKNYYRLAPNKTIGLKYFALIKCTNVITDDDGNVLELEAEYISPLSELKKRPKNMGFIHWVSNPSLNTLPQKCEVRLYDTLFLHENPSKLDDYTKYINPDSLIVKKNALIDSGFANDDYIVPYHAVQFERQGYFAVDPDTTDNLLVWNRTVPLSESKTK